MAVLANNDLVSRELLTRGYWELQSPAHLAQLAGAPPSLLTGSPGTFLDIGANLGFFSLLFAHAGFNVLAIEPMLLNRRAIQASLCANPAMRINLLPIALGAHSRAKTRCVVRADDRNAGNGKLSCSADERCGAGSTSSVRSSNKPAPSGELRRLREQHASGTGGTNSHISICEPVELTTLDELFQVPKVGAALRSHPLKAVKMDVEGFECNVLSGGRSLFTRHAPALLLAEANRKHVKACLRSAASDFGYRTVPFQPTHSGGELGDINFILVRSEAARAVAAGAGAGGCTWSSGCCERHPRVEACKRAAAQVDRTRLVRVRGEGRRPEHRR
jgi:FkbM family methyltransferase